MAQEALTIAPGAWSASVGQLLALAVDELEPVRLQVESGRAQLFTVCAGSDLLGAFVLRIDERGASRDGVIVAAAGGAPGVNLTASCLPAIEQMFSGCDRIRLHTARHGLAKMLAAHFGYRLMELVLVKEIECLT